MTNNNISMNAMCIKFFVNPPANNKDAIYAEALERAYGDMSRHTLHFNEAFSKLEDKKEKEKEITRIKVEIAELLKNEEDSLFECNDQDEYNNWHKNRLYEIVGIFIKEGYIEKTYPEDTTDKNLRHDTFSIGQAQKILNMVIKYVYMFYQYFNAVDNSYEKELQNFSHTTDLLHTPVDSYVIDAACKKKNNKYCLGCKKPDYAWSQLSYEEYNIFQKDIRDKLKAKGDVPFLWELNNYPFK